jgi:hypothetical protein
LNVRIESIVLASAKKKAVDKNMKLYELVEIAIKQYLKNN